MFVLGFCGASVPFVDSGYPGSVFDELLAVPPGVWDIFFLRRHSRARDLKLVLKIEIQFSTTLPCCAKSPVRSTSGCCRAKFQPTPFRISGVGHVWESDSDEGRKGSRGLKKQAFRRFWMFRKCLWWTSYRSSRCLGLKQS